MNSNSIINSITAATGTPPVATFMDSLYLNINAVSNIAKGATSTYSGNLLNSPPPPGNYFFSVQATIAISSHTAGTALSGLFQVQVVPAVGSTVNTDNIILTYPMNFSDGVVHVANGYLEMNGSAVIGLPLGTNAVNIYLVNVTSTAVDYTDVDGGIQISYVQIL